jgi:hypothetical protein
LIPFASPWDFGNSSVFIHGETVDSIAEHDAFATFRGGHTNGRGGGII